MISSPTRAKAPVFTVVISEKGGAERREVFDRPEITMGRVQGNDLTLPKGNVSKKHARLLFRDGRFIVTDMNSTNGTYVNRRRISQATIVREGDRIYVGDFVLRIEMTEGGEAAAPSEVSSSGPLPTQHAPSSSDGVEEVVSAEPVDSDVDVRMPKVPGPPRVPATTTPSRLDSISEDSVSAPMHFPQEQSRPSIDSRQLASTQDSPGLVVDSAQRAAVVAVCQRVEGMLDARSLDEIDDAVVARVERLIDEQSRSLRGTGEIGAAVAADRLVKDVRAELLELGPLRGLMDDPEVTSVTASRFDRVIATRAGRQVAVEPAFSSEASLRRIVARLCATAGTPQGQHETVVERRLADGTRVSAVLGAGALAGALLVLQKPRRVSVTLDDLVRSGTISRAMATFLLFCVQGRANMLIIGPRDAGVPALSSALAAAGGDTELVAVEDVDSLVTPGPHVTRLSIDRGTDDGARLIHVASRIEGSRLVVELGSSDVVAGVLEVIGEGADGVVAIARAPGIRRAVARLTAEVAAGRAGTSAAAAREWIASAFDIVVETSRLRDGRQRVLRIAELSGVEGDEIHPQDIFTFNVERTAAGGAIEGTFTASGTVPRVVEEMNSRGVLVETSLFTRPPSR